MTPAVTEAAYSCGPVRLELVVEDASLAGALHGFLAQYDTPWPAIATTIRVAIEGGGAPLGMTEPSGNYLQLHHLRVDRHDRGLVSLGNLGVSMEFDLAHQARIGVPLDRPLPALAEEIEQQLMLLLTRGWAQAGWTPLHAGSLIPPHDNRCVLVCAPSGGGKSTFISAMLRRGWRTLGDDKALLRHEADGVVARALTRRFHLDPSSSRWFPEAGDLEAWPRYSRWTGKRVVRIEGIWPDRLMDSAIPAGVVQLERAPAGPHLAVEALDQIGVMNTLLRQVVLPADAAHARPLINCVAATAAPVRGALIRVGDNAFADPAIAVRLEDELRRLLA
jgi:hypothetical protein